jgi:hypothetical protein
METVAIVLDEREVVELKMIVMDEDAEQALQFLKKTVLTRILRKEKGKMDVDGKTRL